MVFIIEARAATLSSAFALLAEADHSVEDGEAGEKHRGRGVTGHQLVDQRRRQQHDLHEVLVLAEEGSESTFSPSARRFLPY